MSTPAVTRHAVLQGLTHSLSIALGYFPVAFSFGLMAIQAGFSPLLAIMTSVVVYAGAAQFVLVALAAAGAGPFSIIGTILLMNVRHLFYGPSILDKLGQGAPLLPAPLLAFWLTDEVYAASVSRLDSMAPADRQGWYLGMQLGAYASWVGGTILGALLGQQLWQQSAWLNQTLDFVLPSLFMALLLENVPPCTAAGDIGRHAQHCAAAVAAACALCHAGRAGCRSLAGRAVHREGTWRTLISGG